MHYLTKIFNLNTIKFLTTFLLVFAIGFGGPMYVFGQTYNIFGEEYTEEEASKLPRNSLEYETYVELRASSNIENNTDGQYNQNEFLDYNDNYIIEDFEYYTDQNLRLPLQVDPTLNNREGGTYNDYANEGLRLQPDIDPTQGGRNVLYNGTYSTSDSQNRPDTPEDGLFQYGSYRDGINPLYPAKGTPNEVNLESLGIDLLSCIGALAVVGLAHQAIDTVKETGERTADAEWRTSVVGTLGTIIAASNSGGFVPVVGGVAGGGAVAAAAAAISATTILGPQIDSSGSTQLESKEAGFDVFGLNIGPSKDGIAFCSKQIFIAYLQASIIDWVNNAFNEAAVWVEDLEQTLNDAANIAFKEAIGEVTLCANVKLNVELSALANLLRTERAPERKGCTVSFDRTYNLILTGQAFDYNRFYNITNDPSASAIGGYLGVESRFTTLRNKYEKVVLTELDWFDGFWPWKDQYGRTLTPGNVIEQKIMKVISWNEDNLILADEMDELIFMIFNQLIKVNLSDSLSV